MAPNTDHQQWVFVPLFALAILALALLALLSVALFPALAESLIGNQGGTLPLGLDDKHGSMSGRTRILVFVGCLLPPLLAGIICTLISKRERLDHLRPRIFRGLEADLVEFGRVADTIWTFELERVRTDLRRAEAYAYLWAGIASLALVGSTAFLLPPVRLEKAAIQPWFVALTVVGAVATRFLLDLGNLAIRAANGDATRRMFAEAIKGLIGSILSSVVIMLLVQLLGVQQLNESIKLAGGTTAMGIGCAVAIIGAAAFEWVQARLSALFGIARRAQLGGTALSHLEDIGDLEIERLAEEGIHSVEALVNTSIPRVFLGTRFSLQRIVNWHDAGLLVARIGADAAKELRTRWGIRGSIEVTRSFASAELRAILKPIFQKTLRVDNELEAELVLHHLTEDARVKLTQVMRHTVVQWQPAAVADPNVVV